MASEKIESDFSFKSKNIPYFKLTGRNAVILGDIFQYLSNINDKVAFICNPEGITCKSCDKKNAALLSTSLNSEFFSNYELTSTFLINLPWNAVWTFLSKPLILGGKKAIPKNLMVKFEDENISFEFNKQIKKSFKNEFREINDIFPQTLSIFSTTIDLYNISQICKFLKFLNSESEIVLFKCENQNFALETVNKSEKCEVDITHLVKIHKNEFPLKTWYSIEYIFYFLKCFEKTFEKVTLSLADKKPLLMTLNATGCIIEFSLAPLT